MRDSRSETAAFDAFYRRYVRLVYAAALASCANPQAAEDLTQETLLRAWRHFSAIQERDRAARIGWLLQTLRHLTTDTRRREKPERYAAISERDEDNATQDADRDDPLLRRIEVARALTALSPVDREIVVLRYFGEYNSREIGEALNLPEGTVRRRLAECRRALSQELAHWNEAASAKGNPCEKKTTAN